MNTNHLDAFILTKLGEFHTAGASLALIRGDSLAYARGYGYRDVEAALPCTSRTNFAIASVTKSFTALAILQLAEAGALSVDDPVSEHLPEFDIRPASGRILIRHLLSHSSGIPSLASSEMEWSALVGAAPPRIPLATHDSLLAYGNEAGDWLVATPGRQMRYCNYGFHLLGAIVERRAGMPFQQYVLEQILAPLKMDGSYFAKSRHEADDDVSAAYIMPCGERQQIPTPFRAVTAAGGLFSNALDLSRYTRMYLSGGELDGARVISQANLAEMTSAQVALPNSGLLSQSAYCFGLMRTEDFLGHTMIEHGGGQPFSTSYIAWLPDIGLGAVVLMNGRGYSTMRLAQIGLAALLGEDWRDLPFLQRERTLDSLVGDYEAYRSGYRLTVRRVGAQLFLERRDAHSQMSIPLLEERLGKFRYRFMAPLMGERVTLLFHHKRGEIDLHFDRYLLRKETG